MRTNGHWRPPRLPYTLLHPVLAKRLVQIRFRFGDAAERDKLVEQGKRKGGAARQPAFTFRYALVSCWQLTARLRKVSSALAQRKG